MSKHDETTAPKSLELDDEQLAGVSGGVNARQNFEIQRLMSSYNQAETLASSLKKKEADTQNAVIGKIG